MGFMDKFKFGKNKPGKVESVKGPSATLRDAGIDPSNLKFSFKQDGSIAVSGQVDSQPECDQICQVLEGISNVSGVQNNMTVGAPVPEPVPEPAPEPAPEPEVAVADAGDDAAEAVTEKGRTYTVQSGDSLWAIAEKMYGSGGKYMKIFEANSTLLDSPDRIFPGQELVIPDID